MLTQAVQAPIAKNASQIDLTKAREIAIVSLIAPVLYMASLVSSAILMIQAVGESWLFSFWLSIHIFMCAACSCSARESAASCLVVTERP